MRFKRRYFCLEVHFQDADLSSMSKRVQIEQLRHTHLSDAIHKSIERFYGDHGMATMMPSFSIIYFNLHTRLAIMRTARDLQEQFHNVLTFTRRLLNDQIEVAFQVVHVSGSIRKCKKFLLDYCHVRLQAYISEKSTTHEPRRSADERMEAIEALDRIIKVCEKSDNVFNLN